MQKNLSKDCFNGLIPQNEIIELGLTHHYDSIDLDMADMFDRAEMMGKKFACQFLKSASIQVGCFDLPITLGGSDAEFAETLTKVAKIADLAKEVGAQRCRLKVASNGNRAYHENFELHRQQIAQIAESMAPFGLSIGLAITASVDDDAAYQFVRKPDELLTLAKMVAKPNVGILLDTGAWQQSGGTIEGIRKLKPEQIVDVVLCDANPDDGNRKLPQTDDHSFCVEVVKFLGESGYAGTVSVSGDPAEFESSKSIDVASRLNDIYQTLCIKAGLIEGPPADEEPAVEETPTAAV